jgi:DnaJ-domain-containing protein 1
MHRMDQHSINQALQLFGLSASPTREELEQKHRELLATWHPPRYANLTNNPRKYMTMYKKGEAMTKEIEAAYELLSAWLSSRQGPQGSSADKLTR